MKKPKCKKVGHHVIYQSQDHKRAQGDIIANVDMGVHAIITDVQHRIANNDEVAGWCLLFEGFKRVLKARLEHLVKEGK